ncbi:16S rRNA (adenine(1518)-N(6)/adenine(1519)-N(6))-dimethyltransferase RsmA [Dysosmobacter sp.]|uniref:16S rRNA (adenine(1518)-N(6)/adenine(1519)-N(6))- dimethyltransferase RsmA n=1 Tax=Dysosmobacter sp. TaxID=2591382 RepID=UPI002A878BCD|nr:16S rRNA (adenine(1518)-N(6)/adenine(1519)-N(6))-dimethyltransferase RsmA [Dysosmobacter sp.]MDY3985818.1 16S rRNA (adenine(1518)-N(6)/adenine(1519)-N(6))-dimethyltransferase RsmA [Dysosmobacter sp.]
MNLCDYNDIRELLGRHGFHFSKSMGQNFLIDPQVPRDIAAASQADEGCGVLEIGPGIGPLTAELARRAGKVVSVELDKSLLPVLAETMAPYPNVEIVPGDVMKLDLNALAAEKFQGLRPIVCANLPYNITTPVLTKLVETPCFETVTVLIQREVARRLCAPQGSSDGGSFSLFLQYYMDTELLFDVPPEKFLPAPKVTSSVIRCVRRQRPAVEVADEAWFFKVVRGAFLLRRKTLSNSLASALGMGKEPIQAAIAACGFPPSVRGEQLTLADFARLAEALRGQ